MKLDSLIISGLENRNILGKDAWELTLFSLVTDQLICEVIHADSWSLASITWPHMNII